MLEIISSPLFWIVAVPAAVVTLRLFWRLRSH
ncbi:hypothetical protein LCGC14_1107700 [marine sediment metagenome]|uniref:Uncharacterized protein n=1 Tax=marine sediment metagenome TaxID=412755 RepID=A0A0F9MVK2_9ZZZZ